MHHRIKDFLMPFLQFFNINRFFNFLPEIIFPLEYFGCGTCSKNGNYIDYHISEDLNVKLAKGNMEQVKIRAKLKLCIDQNKIPMEVFLIKFPEMDLVLGLPWLCLIRVFPDYENLSCTFIGNANKVNNPKTCNHNYRPRSGFKTIISCNKFNSKVIEIAYQTKPDVFREIVGFPKDKIFEYDFIHTETRPQ